jgi:hypothetical protein
VHCNPGAAYREVGVYEAEVKRLAGEKDGCGDDVDFIEVRRPMCAAGSSQFDLENFALMKVCCHHTHHMCCSQLTLRAICMHAARNKSNAFPVPVHAPDGCTT